MMKLNYDGFLVTPTGKWCIRSEELYLECKFPLFSFRQRMFIYEGYLYEINECSK